MKTFRTAFFLTLLWTTLAAIPAPAVTLDAVMQATGITTLGEISIQGDATTRGSEAVYAITFDRDGRFVESFDGPISIVTGFDGATAWEVDWNRIPRVLELGDRESALLGAWLWTGQWMLQPDGLEDLRYDDGDGAFHMRLGELQATVVIDPQSNLPTETSFQGSISTWRAKHGYYVAFGDVMLPSRIDLESDRGDHVDMRLRELTTTPAAPYSLREGQAANWHFVDGANETVTMKQVWTGHMLVRVRINGERAGWFVFDSGAGGTAVSTAVAADFELLRIGRSTVGGAGGAVEAYVHRIPKMRVGPVVMHDVGCVSLDMSGFSQAWGEKIAGVIGYDLLARTIVEMTDSPASIKIYERSKYELAGGDWQQLWLPNRNAAVRASFEGHDAIFKLDTGAAASSVIFHVPTVERLRLLEDRETTATNVAGIGGGLPAREGEIAWFEVGGRRFENVEAKFATEAVGAFADRYTAGNIGGQIWGGFTLVFDYAGKRLAYLSD